MKLSEKFKNAAEITNCQGELRAYDEVVNVLTGSRLKNIAVLGAGNCGKTTLINLLAGQEVRKVTRLPLGEGPLMVTFQSDEEREGFEKVNVKNIGPEREGIAFYEIPLNMAVDCKTGKPTKMLEQMDAVLYVVSLIMPFTVEDVSNLSVLVNRFPVTIWLSMADVLDTEEYQSSAAYVKNGFSSQFRDVFCEFYDSRDENAVGKILENYQKAELEELREFHLLQLEERVKIVLSERLEQIVSDIRLQKKALEKKAEADNMYYRAQQMEWSSIRLAMQEKKQDTIDAAKKKISTAKISLKKEALQKLKSANSRKEWLSKEFPRLTEASFHKTTQSVLEDVGEMSRVHTSWLICEVNRKFEQTLTIEDMRNDLSVSAGETGECADTMNYQKAFMAAGTGLIAGSAVLSSLTLLPTCMIAVPATVATVLLMKDSMADYEKYIKNLERFVENCCDKTYENLTKRIKELVDQYYERIISDIIVLSSGQAPSVDFGDLTSREMEALHELKKLDEI